MIGVTLDWCLETMPILVLITAFGRMKVEYTSSHYSDPCIENSRIVTSFSALHSANNRISDAPSVHRWTGEREHAHYGANPRQSTTDCTKLIIMAQSD